MKNNRKQMDYAEDMSFSQSASDNQERGNSAMDEQSEITKELLETAKNLEKNAYVVSSAADGIGRYLLNEDGTIRDFTNYGLIKEMATLLRDGVKGIVQNVMVIQKKIDNFPTEVTAHFSQDDVSRLDKLLKYFKWERVSLWVYISCAAFMMGSFTVKSCSLDKREAELKKWYDANYEAANSGRYIRMHESDRWNYWHKQWRSDPQMMEDMYDANLMKGWENKSPKE